MAPMSSSAALWRLDEAAFSNPEAVGSGFEASRTESRRKASDLRNGERASFAAVARGEISVACARLFVMKRQNGQNVS
jgi:hypothetical protein